MMRVSRVSRVSHVARVARVHRLSRVARVWLPPVAMMGLIFALSAMPAGNADHGTLYAVARKVAHFAEYALLLALWWRALATTTDDRRALAVALAITLLYAISDELHQTFVSGRAGRPLDVGIDMVGALVAAAVIARRAPRRARTA